jgi:hypothetical protein
MGAALKGPQADADKAGGGQGIMGAGQDDALFDEVQAVLSRTLVVCCMGVVPAGNEVTVDNEVPVDNEARCSEMLGQNVSSSLVADGPGEDTFRFTCGCDVALAFTFTCGCDVALAFTVLAATP